MDKRFNFPVREFSQTKPWFDYRTRTSKLKKRGFLYNYSYVLDNWNESNYNSTAVVCFILILPFRNEKETGTSKLSQRSLGKGKKLANSWPLIADRRVSNNYPRINCGTLVGSSSHRVFKEVNGSVDWAAYLNFNPFMHSIILTGLWALTNTAVMQIVKKKKSQSLNHTPWIKEMVFCNRRRVGKEKGGINTRLSLQFSGWLLIGQF